MAASQNDKFLKSGASTVTTLSAPGKALAATSINVGSTTNYPTDTGIVFAIRQVDSDGELIAGTYTEWIGTVTSGTTLAMNGTPVYGSDQVYPAGSTTQVYIPVSSYAHNRLVDGLLLEHKNTGLHGAVTADSLVSAGAVTGTTLTGTSVVSSGDIQHRSTSLETIRTETQFDYIASGGVWSGDAYASTRNASMTAVTCYIGGRRGTVSAVTARSFTASKDTYVDILNTAGTFSLVYTEVTNNTASPALAANSIRLAIIVTGASNIAAAGSVNQGEETKVLPIASSIPYQTTDSLGNLICPRDPTRKVLGYRQLLASTAASTTSGAQQAILGLSCPVVVPAGRRVRVSMGLGIGVISSGGSGSPVSVAIARGSVSTIVAQANGTTSASAGSAAGLAGNPIGVEVPGSGSFTYLGCYAGSGATTTAIVGGSPISILVELA